jgi:two-component system sensor histidine kinase CpxA
VRLKSLYAKILLLSFGIFVGALLCFVIMSRAVSYRHFASHGRSAAHFTSQVAEAVRSFKTGGPPALASYIRSVEFAYAGNRYFLLRRGRDVLTGEDRAPLAARAKSLWPVFDLSRPMLIAMDSTDGEYTFVRLADSPDKMLYLGFCGIFLCGLAALGWLLTSHFAKPLRTLANTVRRFGSDDLSVRLYSTRRDEIGEVSQAFDSMANRIEALVAAERRLLEDVSHELRSPLARLSVAAELGLMSSDREAAAIRVKREVGRLTSLVDNLLSVTRAENDPDGQLIESVTLNTLISHLVEDCEIEASAKQCKLSVKMTQTLTLRADMELLRRAIENVLRNAIRHAPPGSVIEVAAREEGGTISISVRDYGSGVPSEDLTRIFDPFFRVDTARDTASGGVGLGLAIAQRAIRVHRGEILAENAEPGLRVRVNLPVDQPVETAVP